MSKMYKKVIFLLLLFLVFPRQIEAFKPETFITIANPVRGPEGWQHPKQTPLELPLFQYQESTKSGLPVTWLLRFDAIEDASISGFFKNLLNQDSNQSLGAFLEITPNLTQKSGVDYPDGTLFFNANRIFLSGYSNQDRIKLIDTYMNSFFSRFGFYPQSVSAWHLDSYSLQYLQSKYSVLTAMNCDDQYSTDHYRLWGGYLGSPYFPDKNNSLIPADSFNNRINLAMVRWAQRDLFNFYGYRFESSYSVQVNDYLSMGQGVKYFERLLLLYGQKKFNEFTHVNIGLENDYDLKQYMGEIQKVYQTIDRNRDKFNLRPISLSDFGDWFKARYPESSPAYFYETSDPKGVSNGKVYWYQDPYYRIGIKSQKGKSYIIDFRVYNRNIYEDNFSTPNQSLDLYHEIPAIIDSVKWPNSEIEIDIDLEKADLLHSKQQEPWLISFWQDGKILTLGPKKISFGNFNAPPISNKSLNVISTKDKTTWKITPYTPHQPPTKFTLLKLSALLVVFWIINKKKAGNWPKSLRSLLTIFTIVLILSVSLLTVYRNGKLYQFGIGFWGPNGHDAIFHLSLIEKFANAPFDLSHPQLSGERIVNYHLGFDYLSGLIVRFTGVNSLDLYFRFFPLIGGLAIIYLLNKLLTLWKYNLPEKIIAILFVFVAGSFGFIAKLIVNQDIFSGESAFWSNQSISIFLNPPFVLSLITLLLFLVKLEVWKKPKTFQLLCLLLLGSLLAQIKVYAFILLILALMLSRQTRLSIGVFVVGIIISLPFVSSSVASPFVLNPLWFSRSLFASPDRVYWPRLVMAWQAYEASGNFPKLLLVNLFALIIFIAGNLGVRILGLFHIFLSNDVNRSEKIVRWIVILGLLIPIMITQDVNPWNTIQFMYYSIFFLGIFSAKFICHHFFGTQGIVAKILAVVIILFGTFTSIGTLKDYLGVYSSSRVSYTELQALEFLRGQPKGLVLSPIFSQDKSKPISTPKPLYSYVSTAYISALSGQPEFLSDTINLDITGFQYQDRIRDIERLYNTEDKEWAIGFLRENNIKYLYETPLKKIKLSPHDLQLTKIFDSGEINIYKFN